MEGFERASELVLAHIERLDKDWVNKLRMHWDYFDNYYDDNLNYCYDNGSDCWSEIYLAIETYLICWVHTMIDERSDCVDRIDNVGYEGDKDYWSDNVTVIDDDHWYYHWDDLMLGDESMNDVESNLSDFCNR